MKQVTVIRKVPVSGNPTFEVRTAEELIKCFNFEFGAAENDIYNEETNRLAAMALAARIENGNTDIEEIIYQTPPVKDVKIDLTEENIKTLHY